MQLAWAGGRRPGTLARTLHVAPPSRVVRVQSVLTLNHQMVKRSLDKLNLLQ